MNMTIAEELNEKGFVFLSEETMPLKLNDSGPNASQQQQSDDPRYVVISLEELRELARDFL